MMFLRLKGFFAFTLVWFGQVISIMGSTMSGFTLTIWAWKETRFCILKFGDQLSI